MLLVEECYTAEDTRFVEHLRGVSEPQALASLSTRWTQDPRPWARAQMFRYLAEPFDRPGHALLIKRLFKHAEKTADAELMGAFLAAFDCLVRRVRRKSAHWDMGSRSFYTIEELATPRNTFRPPQMQWNPKTRKDEKTPMPARPTDRSFLYRTRYYLQRRAWRWFRRLGFQNAAAYVPAVAGALARYRDEDFQKGENYLDSWGFMHVCFGTHTAVEFSTFRAGFREGSGLADLSPAPAFPALWFSAEGARAAVGLAISAGARAVRLWAVRLLALPGMNLAATLQHADLQRLLAAEDEEIQTAAIALLRQAPDVARWTVPQWLALLEIPAPAVADAVSALMQEHVHPDRLTPEQSMELACARPVSLARMGLNLLREKPLGREQTLALLPRAADARCEAVAGDLASLCLDRIAAAEETFDREPLSRFFDSLNAATRLAAWTWLCAHRGHAAWDDPVLWSRLTETPFDDLRLRLVDELARRAAMPGNGAADFAPVWTSVLLGVHRGSRQKPKAAQQIAAAIHGDHARADTLLPVLAVAVRSLRAPEQRAGLAAVASLMDAEPLTAAVQRHLPEVQWS